MPMATNDSARMTAVTARATRLPRLPVRAGGGASLMIGQRRFPRSATHRVPLPLSHNPPAATSGTERCSADRPPGKRLESSGIRRGGPVLAAAQILGHVDQEAAAAARAETGLARQALHRQILGQDLRRERAQAQLAGL